MSETHLKPPPAVQEDPWLRCSAEGEILDASGALASLLAFDSVEAFREEVPRIHHLFGNFSDRSRITAPLQVTLATAEVRWIRRDRTSIWVQLQVGPETSSQAGAVDAETGNLPLRVTVKDVTSRQHLQEQLRQAQSTEAVGQLASGMAIDLNDSLTAILAHLDLLEAGLAPEDRERVGHDLGEIRRTATTGGHMVKHLLSVSRGERIRIQSVSLEEVVRDTMRLIRPVLPEGIEVLTDLSKVDAVLADPAAVEQMLLTLVTNARDAMSGGGTLKVTLAAGGFDEDHLVRMGWGDPGDFGVITVRDNGRGMSPQAVAHLFQPFSSDRLTGDSGLSMAVVYGLMKQHRGFIQVESEPGEGTTARLFFRKVQRQSLPTSEKVESKTKADGEMLLFVEDDENLRRVTCRILRSQGYRVLEASNGTEALEIIEREGAPDILVVDLIMPGMTGVELLERLERESRLPRVLLTSGFRPEFLLGWENVQPSAHPFLEKPWQIETLLEKVRRVLEA